MSISGRIDPDTLSRIFGEEFTKGMEFREIYTSPTAESIFVTGSAFLALSNVTTGFCLMSFYDGTTTKVNFGRVGSDGFIKRFNFLIGPADNIENNLAQKIREQAQNLGLSINEGSR